MPRSCPNLSEIVIAVDVLLLVAVLQLVVLDVEPKSLHDAGPRLRVHAQQPSQPQIQFVLRRLCKKIFFLIAYLLTFFQNDECGGTKARTHLVVEHEQKGAFDVDVAGPFDLETVRLLSGGHSVPLTQEIC